MTPSEEYMARYKETKKVADALGRILVIRRLRPSQRLAVLRAAESENRDVFMPLMIAASVQQIDDAMLTFPKSLAEINSVLDKLDEPGLEVATKAYIELNLPEAVQDDPAPDAEAA